MSNPLTGGIAKQVYKAAKAAKLTLPATLSRATPGTRTGGNVTAGTNPTTTNYACAGFVEDFGAGQIDGTLITVHDRKITLYGASLPSGVVPAINDKVTIVGATFTLQHVQGDPAGGVYVCQGRTAG